MFGRFFSSSSLVVGLFCTTTTTILLLLCVQERKSVGIRHSHNGGSGSHILDLRLFFYSRGSGRQRATDQSKKRGRVSTCCRREVSELRRERERDIESGSDDV